MSATTYTVVGVDFDLGICSIRINLPDGSQDTFNVDPYAVCSSVENTELQLKKALDQVVAARLLVLFPPEAPRPAALTDLVGQEITLGGE